MIPTPERVAANRRWSAIIAAMMAAIVVAIALTVQLGPVWEGVCLLLAFLVAAVMYSYGTRIMRRRRQVMKWGLDKPLADVLRQRVNYYRGLDAAGRERFELLAAIFLDEVVITGAGCEVTDEIRALVAASAVIPILGFPDWEYSTLREVLIQPDEFSVPRIGQHGFDDSDSLLGMVDHAGGAFHGTLMLSRTDLLKGFKRGLVNVGIHEFAHLVDEGDGAIDGVPAWLPRKLIHEWLDMIHSQLNRGPEPRQRRGRNSRADGGSPAAAPGEQAKELEDWSDMPEYAFTDEGEFFAVSAEYFFQWPRRMARNHPRLYDMLRQTFRQDPAASQPAAAAEQQDA